MPPVLRVQPARARAIVGDPVTARPYRMPRIIFKLWLEAESFAPLSSHHQNMTQVLTKQAYCAVTESDATPADL
jgi:hypothetical protein